MVDLPHTERAASPPFGGATPRPGPSVPPARGAGPEPAGIRPLRPCELGVFRSCPPVLVLKHHNGVTYAPVMPPSTTNWDAVMNDESSLARKATAAAISAGSA